jgi:Flp pilus assembly pilin Flp
MQRMLTLIERLAIRDDAQDLLEYGLLAALIAVVAVAGVTTLGRQLNSVFWQTIASSI